MTGLSPRFLASTARWVTVPFTKLRNYGENQLRSFWVCSCSQRGIKYTGGYVGLKLRGKFWARDTNLSFSSMFETMDGIS